MVRIVRHRQPKGPATDRPHLNHRATSRLYYVFRHRFAGPKTHLHVNSDTCRPFCRQIEPANQRFPVVMPRIDTMPGKLSCRVTLRHSLATVQHLAGLGKYKIFFVSVDSAASRLP